MTDGNASMETAQQQIVRLATFIMDEVPGEPSADGGAVDCAIRLLREREAYLQPLAAVLAYLRVQGLDRDAMREIVGVHAAERVPDADQRAFIQFVLG